MPEALLTVEEFANRTHQHAQTVRRQIRRGAVPIVRTGRKYLIPESAATPMVATPPVEAEAPTELSSEDFAALFAPPAPEEIAHRLAALDSIKRGAIARDPAAREIDGEADLWGYEERTDNLMENCQ